MDPKAARWINVVMGAWLFVSAFLWSHTSAQYANTWIMGVVTVVVALSAVGATGFRFLNTAAGAWLMISAFVLPTMSAGTRWNNFIVGFVIGLLSLVGASSNATPLRRLRPA